MERHYGTEATDKQIEITNFMRNRYIQLINQSDKMINKRRGELRRGCGSPRRRRQRPRRAGTTKTRCGAYVPAHGAAWVQQQGGALSTWTAQVPVAADLDAGPDGCCFCSLCGWIGMGLGN